MCVHWFILQLAAFIPLFSAMEAVLMLRVYALYNHSKRIGFTLLALFTLELAAAIGCPISIMPRVKFDAVCTGEIAPSENLIFGGSVFTAQFTIAVLTIAKRSAGQTNVDTKIVRTVLRDGLWVFAAVIVAVSYIIFSWPISVFSFITCRVILNLQRMKVETVDQPPRWYTGGSPSEIELPPFLSRAVC
ncbi:hypothetical protein BDQ17DRAFT_1526530 [Cyathus striatus]|nr:hypothetical protein BDQ17DRAFT_1526530 [Cyathus striatus]